MDCTPRLVRHESVENEWKRMSDHVLGRGSVHGGSSGGSMSAASRCFRSFFRLLLLNDIVNVDECFLWGEEQNYGNKLQYSHSSVYMLRRLRRMPCRRMSERPSNRATAGAYAPMKMKPLTAHHVDAKQKEGAIYLPRIPTALLSASFRCTR